MKTNKMHKRLLFILIVFSSCITKNPRITFKVREKKINFRSLISLKNDISYPNRFGLKEIDGNIYLINLSKSNDLIFFNLMDGSARQIHTELNAKVIDAIMYDDTYCEVIINHILYRIDYLSGNLKAIMEVPLKPTEYIIENIYSQTLFNFKKYHYLQYGVDNKFNWIDSFALRMFNKDTSFNFIFTPPVFKKKYIHYSEISVANIKDTFYYTYSTIPVLYRKVFNSQSCSTSPIPGKGYLDFDTTKSTNVLYITDYSKYTTYNIRLFPLGGRIFIVQRSYKKDKDFIYKLIGFDRNLNLLSESIIQHPVDPNFIFVINGKLIFLVTQERKLYEYEID